MAEPTEMSRHYKPKKRRMKRKPISQSIMIACIAEAVGKDTLAAAFEMKCFHGQLECERRGLL